MSLCESLKKDVCETIDGARDHIVEIGKSIRRTLFDNLHALFRSDLTIGQDHGCRSWTPFGVIGGHSFLD